MKDTAAMARRFGGGSVAGLRGMARATDHYPCPVCGRHSLCFVATDGAEAWCSQVSDGAVRTVPNGPARHLHIHRAGGRPWKPPPAPPHVTAERAPPDALDAAYRALLARLTLDAADRAALLARGLPAEHVDAGQYRTLRVEGRAALARAVVDDVGELAAARVPGVVWKTGDDGRGWWSIAGSPGVLVLCRDLEGRVVALKVRRRDPCDGARYLYVSSAASGGPSALAAVHIPRAALELRASNAPLVITEGELKADVATALLGRPVVSVPGVSNWRAGVDLARAWGARVVAVAFDADAATNPDVARHMRALLAALRAEGFDARLWQWPPAEGKGLDDLLRGRLARAASPTDGDHAERTPAG